MRGSELRKPGGLILIGEKFEGKTRSLSFKGLGVVDHPNGQVFFVRGTWPGDEGVYEIEIQEKKYGFAKLVDLKKASLERQVPPCPHLGFEPGKCGGCPWMIASYDSQSIEKENLLKSLLKKSEVLKNPEALKPLQKSPKGFGYRNRAQFKTNGEKLGYISAGTNVLAEIENCIILTPQNQKTLKDLRAKLPNPNWKPTGKYDWNFIEIDEDVNADSVVPNHRRAFKQANSEQNEFMKNWLKEKIKNLDKSKEVLELFCGSGNFTRVLSDAGFVKIVASEMSDVSISDLKDKNLKNVLGIKANLFNSISWNTLKNQSQPEILFLDPPREGFKSLDLFLKMFKKVKTIIYISCDVSTFVQDVKQIQKLGFEIKELVPLDQFPQTPHLEILSVLELSK